MCEADRDYEPPHYEIPPDFSVRLAPDFMVTFTPRRPLTLDFWEFAACRGKWDMIEPRRVPQEGGLPVLPLYTSGLEECDIELGSDDNSKPLARVRVRRRKQFNAPVTPNAVARVLEADEEGAGFSHLPAWVVREFRKWFKSIFFIPGAGTPDPLPKIGKELVPQWKRRRRRF